MFSVDKGDRKIMATCYSHYDFFVDFLKHC